MVFGIFGRFSEAVTAVSSEKVEVAILEADGMVYIIAKEEKVAKLSAIDGLSSAGTKNQFKVVQCSSHTAAELGEQIGKL